MWVGNNEDFLQAERHMNMMARQLGLGFREAVELPSPSV